MASQKSPSTPRPRSDPTWPGPDGREPTFLLPDLRVRVLDARGAIVALPASPKRQAQMERLAGGRDIKGPLAAHAVATAACAIIGEVDASLRAAVVAKPTTREWWCEFARLAAALRHLRLAARWVDDVAPGAPAAWSAFAAGGNRVDAGSLGVHGSVHQAVQAILDHVERHVLAGVHHADFLAVGERIDEAVARPGIAARGRKAIQRIAEQVHLAEGSNAWIDSLLPSSFCKGLWRNIGQLLEDEVGLYGNADEHRLRRLLWAQAQPFEVLQAGFQQWDREPGAELPKGGGTSAAADMIPYKDARGGRADLGIRAWPETTIRTAMKNPAKGRILGLSSVTIEALNRPGAQGLFVKQLLSVDGLRTLERELKKTRPPRPPRSR